MMYNHSERPTYDGQNKVGFKILRKGKQMKKVIVGALMVSTMALLTGCHMSHDWQEATCITPRTCLTGGETEGEVLGHTWVDATCTEPKTCSVCGETEGEPLGHIWVEATCSEAKHCSVCGVTEGEPLEHTLTEANYQQAATCTVCGEIVGEPLQAEFETYGWVHEAELDTPYPYTTPCYTSQAYATTGTVTFSDYEVFASDATHEALEGYEWHAVTITFYFEDDNVKNYGIYGSRFSRRNYYQDELEGEITHYTVNYYGEDYTECAAYQEETVFSWDDIGRLTIQWCYYERVPEGYDGDMLVIFTDDTDLTVSSFGDVEADNVLYYRLK